MTLSNLIEKYNVAAPRYTSYPTVPFWDENSFSTIKWLQNLKKTFDLTNSTKGISLYIHLPFCESLCTFCACHKRITKNHSVEDIYIETVLKEWQMYQNLFEAKPVISEIHLGGGTPSFFSAKNLEKLINGLLKDTLIHHQHEFGFEGHPNNTSEEHLRILAKLGFKRVSFGVQDYDPRVQQAIHRIQPFENVQRVTETARNLGYTSISHDLVFGLPFQKPESIEQTIAKTISLQPDRLAFYSYAHVPWIKGNGQRGFDENDLPKANQKRELYELGRQIFEENQYFEIGMDHFALKTDSLYKSMQDGTLHRNFMGYTTTQSDILLGLGMSSISDSWGAFSQNIKDLEGYQSAIQQGQFPILKGHILSEEDLFIRQQILNIMCQSETNWKLADWKNNELDELLERLEGFRDDGLIEFNEFGLRVLPKGKPFLRNICMTFDKRLLQTQPKNKVFSQAI